MKIEQTFNYEAHWVELADEFCDHDSEYQAKALNNIGLQFKIWAQDKKRTATHIQLLEIAEQLDDNGKWFIKTLCDYMEGKAEGEWVDNNCSICGYSVNPWNNTPYCPNCGADMSEEIEK